MDEALQLDEVRFGENDILCEEVGGDDTGVVVGDMAYMHDEHMMLHSGVDEMGLDMSEYEVAGVSSDMHVLGGEEEVLTMHTSTNQQTGAGSEAMEVEESPSKPVAVMQSPLKLQKVARVVSTTTPQFVINPVMTSGVQVAASRPAVREIPIAPKPQSKPVSNQGKLVAISSASAKRLVAGGRQLVMLGGGGPRLKLLPGHLQPLQQTVVLPKTNKPAQLQRFIVQGAAETRGGATGGLLAKVVPAGGGPPRFITLPPQQADALAQQMMRVRPPPAPRQVAAAGQVKQQPRLVPMQQASKKLVVAGNAAQKVTVSAGSALRQQAPGLSQVHQISVPGKGVQYIRVVTPARQPVVMTQQKLVRIAPVAKSPSSQSLLTKLAVPTSPAKPASSPTRQQPRLAQSLLAPRPARPASPPSHTEQETEAEVTVPSAATFDDSEIIISELHAADKFSESVLPDVASSAEDSAEREASGASEGEMEESKAALRNLVANFQQQQLVHRQQQMLEHIEVPEADAEYLHEEHDEHSPELADAADEVKPYLKHGGGRLRKPCNCTKSQCLKLYCDCFANGEFCNSCNCANCHNNLEHESLRQRAIRTCLERNPNAFRPKIGKTKAGGPEPVRRHNKGCNCKRSGCLKNYCECYEAKIACSVICRCVGCRNVEDASGRLARDDAHSAHTLAGAELRPPPGLAFRQPTSFMTGEVVEAVCLCLVAAGAAATGDPIAAVIDEFSRCLQDIIGASEHNAAAAPGVAAT